MSTTPRTDAQVAALKTKFSNVASDYLAMVDFAKLLERELQRRGEEAANWELRCRTNERLLARADRDGASG